MVTLKVEINLEDFYNERAELKYLDTYIQKARDIAGEGNEVVLTGAAPIWMYLKIAHALHGKARRLIYSPAALNEDIIIFDHSA